MKQTKIKIKSEVNSLGQRYFYRLWSPFIRIIITPFVPLGLHQTKRTKENYGKLNILSFSIIYQQQQ